MKNQNTLILLLILLVLSIGYYFMVFRKTKSSFDPEETAFSIKDTSAIQSIRFSYNLEGKTKRTLTLSRKDSTWLVNEKYPALQPKVSILLKTLRLLRAKEPVLPQAKTNMLNLMAREHTEVEILFKNGSIKSYKVGTNSPDNMGTFMLLKGADNIYVTFIPGHTGYLNSRYSSLEDDWKENLVFDTSPEKVEWVKIEYASSKDSSFVINRNATGEGWLLNGQAGGALVDAYLSNFKKIIAESMVEKYYPGKKEELQKLRPDIVFEVKNVGEPVFQLKIWRRPDCLDLYFALSNQPEAALISLQEFHFGPFLKARKDFLAEKL
jgi:hypothetical protein